MVSRPVFADAFWQCYNTLKATATPEAGMPGYFRFLTLLSESHKQQLHPWCLRAVTRLLSFCSAALLVPAILHGSGTACATVDLHVVNML